MAELTLESLAARIEVLERLVAPRAPVGLKNGVVAHPGTGDWSAAFEAIDRLTDYDLGAIREQDECDMRHAGDHLP